MNKTTSILYSPRLYHKLLEAVKDKGRLVSPRGFSTYEITNAEIYMKNPLDRVVTETTRKMNIGFAIAEWLSIMSGCDLVDFFTPFIANYGKYSTLGQRIDKSYGSRVTESLWVKDGNSIYNQRELTSHIDSVLNKLWYDPDTRQAVITIYDGKQDVSDTSSKHLPCTLSMQFLIRNKKLHQIVTMRSNDVVKGLTYDIFVFTLIQEFIARQLNIELGNYAHHAASLHLYEDDIEYCKPDSLSRWPHVMDKMPVMTLSDISQLTCEFYKATHDNGYWPDLISNQWSQNLVLAAKCTMLMNKKDKRAVTAYMLTRDMTLKRVLRHQLVKHGLLNPWRHNE